MLTDELGELLEQMPVLHQERATRAGGEGVLDVCDRCALGAPPTVTPYCLRVRLRAFTAAFPEIEVVVHEDTTAQLAAAVAAREIDVALVSLRVERAGQVAEEFLTRTCWSCCRPATRCRPSGA